MQLLLEDFLTLRLISQNIKTRIINVDQRHSRRENVRKTRQGKVDFIRIATNKLPHSSWVIKHLRIGPSKCLPAFIHNLRQPKAQEIF